MAREKNIQRSIVAAVGGIDPARVVVIRMRADHLGGIGLPDLLVIVNGLAVFLEVKKPGEVPTPKQLHTHEKLRRAGSPVHVVTSAAQAVEFINRTMECQR